MSVNSNTTSIADNTQQKNYTLKVLFGPLFGCELLLPEDDYFILTGSNDELIHTSQRSQEEKHAAAYIKNTLYIPGGKGSPNISLNLNHPKDENTSEFDIEIHDIDNPVMRKIRLNDVFTYKHIVLALKESNENWSDEVECFNKFPMTDVNNDPDDIANSKKWFYVMAGVVAFTLLLIVGLFAWHKYSAESKHELTLNEALAGAPSHVEILRSRDKKNIYILSKEYSTSEWVDEALFKLSEKNNVISVWLAQQQHDIIVALKNAGYPVLQINFDTPQHPQVNVYLPLTKSEEVQLKEKILDTIPFAQDVSINVKTKDQLLLEARQGLERQHVAFRQIQTAEGFSLVVRDALNDNTLNALNKFISNFKNKWGDQIITYSVNLDEDWLKNKSYVDSTNGYLFLNPRHWYFPLKAGDE